MASSQLTLGKVALRRRQGVRGFAVAREWEAAAVAVLAVLTAASRLFTAGQYLYNWDSIQYALGVQRFDLVAHRPHPPGYAGYIVAGRLFTAIAGGNPQQGLVLLSACAEAAAVVVLYLAARALFGRFAGAAAAVLFATSPLAWIYGSVALNYGLEPVLAAAVAWAALRACLGSRRALLLGALACAAAGAVRPTDEFFLAAPLAWAAWRTWQRDDRGAVAAAAAAMLLASAAWLVPLLVASGGPARYLVASRELSARASDTSAIWRAGPAGVVRNTTAVAAGLATALGLMVPLGIAHLALSRLGVLRARRRAVPADLAVLTAATLGPAVTVYVLVHIGQLGYLLILLPAILLPAGVVLDELARALSPRHPGVAAVSMLVTCGLANLAIFALPAGGMRDQLAQRDAYARAVIALVRGYDAASTLVVTSAEADGSYRLVQYYLPRYAVVALGRDRGERAGEIFATGAAASWRHGVPEYDLARFDHAGAVQVPAGVRRVLVLDRGAVDLLGERSRVAVVKFGDGWRAWRLDPPASLPVAAGRYVYFVAATCPCRGFSGAIPLASPHRPL